MKSFRVWYYSFPFFFFFFSSLGILQARIQEWVAVPLSWGSSQPRNETQVSRVVGGFFTSWATRKALLHHKIEANGKNSFTRSEVHTKLLGQGSLSLGVEWLCYLLRLTCGSLSILIWHSFTFTAQLDSDYPQFRCSLATWLVGAILNSHTLDICT